MLKELEQAVLECFVAPNHILPKEFHNERTGYVSLAKIDKMCDKLEGLSQAEKDRIERTRRAELYRKQLEENGEIYYEL
jgi:hypothetical protein